MARQITYRCDFCGSIKEWSLGQGVEEETGHLWPISYGMDACNSCSILAKDLLIGAVAAIKAKQVDA